MLHRRPFSGTPPIRGRLNTARGEERAPRRVQRPVVAVDVAQVDPGARDVMEGEAFARQGPFRLQEDDVQVVFRDGGHEHDPGASEPDGAVAPAAAERQELHLAQAPRLRGGLADDGQRSVVRGRLLAEAAQSRAHGHVGCEDPFHGHVGQAHAVRAQRPALFQPQRGGLILQGSGRRVGMDG
jgi:hypothetical protein